MEERIYTIANILYVKPQGWSEDTLLYDGRHVYFERFNTWHSQADAWDHCKRACLLPAITHGFDAAVCDLGTNHLAIFGGDAIVGYSPVRGQTCHTPCCEGFCEEDAPKKKPHLWNDEQIARALRDSEGKSASYNESDNEIWYLEKNWLGTNTWQSINKEESIPKFSPSIRVVGFEQ
ncbi:MAG: hypothetical protein MMC23_006877 [Stictis urceolatum]|nr:hypothetical protein [Stictis urceolata]